jgi:hypothetical protein
MPARPVPGGCFYDLQIRTGTGSKYSIPAFRTACEEVAGATGHSNIKVWDSVRATKPGFPRVTSEVERKDLLALQKGLRQDSQTSNAM